MGSQALIWGEGSVVKDEKVPLSGERVEIFSHGKKKSVGARGEKKGLGEKG